MQLKHLLIRNGGPCESQLPWRRCSVELVHDSVALVECVGSCGHPVGHDDGVVERPEGDVDATDTHAPDVDSPSEDPEAAKVETR